MKRKLMKRLLEDERDACIRGDVGLLAVRLVKAREEYEELEQVYDRMRSNVQTVSSWYHLARLQAEEYQVRLEASEVARAVLERPEHPTCYCDDCQATYEFDRARGSSRALEATK